MKVDILHDFLLFVFADVEKVMHLLTNISWKFLGVLLIAELFMARFRENSNIQEIVKRFLVVQFVIAFMPLYFHPIAKSGFTVGDSILELKKSGIVKNWSNIKKDIQKQTKKEPSLARTFFQFISFENTDIIKKGAVLIIAVIFLLIKVIYSFVYYYGYLTISGRALLSVFTHYATNLSGLLSTLVYLILVPILIAIALFFLNDVLDFDSNKLGFVDTLSGIASFIVLGICLFASFALAGTMIRGQGAESWSSRMGTMMSAGLGYKMLSLGGDFMKTGVSTIASGGASLATKSLGDVVKPVASGVGNMITSPFKQAFSGAKSGLSNHFEQKIQQGEGRRSSFSPIDYQAKNIDINAPITKGRYQSAFENVVGNSQGMSVKSAFNPAHHIKASREATKGAYQSVMAKGRDAIGLPSYTKHLRPSEKLSYMGYKALNGKSASLNTIINKNSFTAQKLTNEQQIQNSVIANRISKTMGKRRGNS